LAVIFTGHLVYLSGIYSLHFKVWAVFCGLSWLLSRKIWAKREKLERVTPRSSANSVYACVTIFRIVVLYTSNCIVTYLQIRMRCQKRSWTETYCSFFLLSCYIISLCNYCTGCSLLTIHSLNAYPQFSELWLNCIRWLWKWTNVWPTTGYEAWCRRLSDRLWCTTRLVQD